MPTDERPYCGRCRTYCAGNAPCPCCESRRVRQPHTLARDAINAYEQRVPGARAARQADDIAQYAHHLTVHLLDIANAAMADEGVEAAARYRVIQAILYGGSNPADAWQREHMQAEFAQRLAAQPPRLAMTPGELDALRAKTGLPFTEGERHAP